MHLPPIPPRPPSLARRLGKFAFFLLHGHSPGLAWWLAVHDATKHQNYRAIAREALTAAAAADPSWTDLVVADGHIRSRALGLEFLGTDSVTRGYLTLLALAPLGWSFTRATSGVLLARRDSLQLRLITDEECNMIGEIFLEGCYDLRLPGEWHVIDIGANVGMAALFFAQQPWCKHVTSFEPFASTADAFAANLALNPDVATKITLVRQAVGETTAELHVHYDPNLRGSMSVTGIGAWRGPPAAGAERVTIQLAPATTALAPAFAALGPCRLLGKIDCEGSEYGIFRELESSGALDQFSAFVIEWHGSGPDEIVRTLQRLGFAVHVSPLSSDHRTLGLIYATRLDRPHAR
jgi:FkbM family methyltransferase